jgi:hypothetical protein
MTDSSAGRIEPRDGRDSPLATVPQSAPDSFLGIAVERRSTNPIGLRGEAVIGFVQKVELARVANAPLAVAAVEAKPQPRAKRQRPVAPFRGQPRDFPAVRRHSPHQMRKLGRDPVARFIIARYKGHRSASSARQLKAYTLSSQNHDFCICTICRLKPNGNPRAEAPDVVAFQGVFRDE